MADSMEPCKMLWVRPLLPWQRHFCKFGLFGTKLPISWLVCQIDQKCLGITGGGKGVTTEPMATTFGLGTEIDSPTGLFIALFDTCWWLLNIQGHGASSESGAILPRSKVCWNSSGQHLSSWSPVQSASCRSSGWVHQWPPSMSALPQVLLLLYGLLASVTLLYGREYIAVLYLRS